MKTGLRHIEREEAIGLGRLRKLSELRRLKG